jgi:hypothetical protein
MVAASASRDTPRTCRVRVLCIARDVYKTRSQKEKCGNWTDVVADGFATEEEAGGGGEEESEEEQDGDAAV